MGHTWSPFLASNITWGILLMDNSFRTFNRGYPNEMCVEEEFYAQIPETTPEFVYIRRVIDNVIIGFLSVYLDNILFACVDHRIAIEMKRKLIENAKAVGAVWKFPKDKDGNTMESPISGPDREVDYVGVQYTWDGIALKWQWPERQRETFRNDFIWTEDPAEWDPRKVFSLIAKRMWMARIAEMPLFVIGDVVRIISVVQEFVRKIECADEESSGWDKKFSSEEFFPMRDDLRYAYENLLTPEIMTKNFSEVPRRMIYAVVDACTTKGMAAVWMNDEGQAERTLQHMWTEQEKPFCRYAVHVESRIICEALENTKETGVTIRLASDALGAMQGIKKGWSKSVVLREYITRSYVALWGKGNNLSLVHVKGKNNFADFPSREWTEHTNVGKRGAPFNSAKGWRAENERRRDLTWAVLRGEDDVKWEGKSKGF